MQSEIAEFRKVIKLTHNRSSSLAEENKCRNVVRRDACRIGSYIPNKIDPNGPLLWQTQRQETLEKSLQRPVPRKAKEILEHKIHRKIARLNATHSLEKISAMCNELDLAIDENNNDQLPIYAEPEQIPTMIQSELLPIILQPEQLPTINQSEELNLKKRKFETLFK